MSIKNIVNDQRTGLDSSRRKHIEFNDVFELDASLSRKIAGITGPVLLGIGSGISISAGFGSLGFSVLLDALHHLWSIPLWISQTLMTILFLGIAWFWGKIRLGVGVLPALLLVGPAISIGASITPDTLSYFVNAIVFATGLNLFALGISLSAAAALGPDGVTALSLAAEKRWRWPVPRSNFLWNFLAIAIGALLGGSLGVGTVMGLIWTPILIRYFLPILRERLVYEPSCE